MCSGAQQRAPGSSNESLLSFALERPFHYLWGLFADVWITLWTIFMGSLAIALMFITRRGRPIDVLGPIWARLLVRACGIRIEMEGAKHLKPGQSYVLISNHLSNFDIWCTLAALPTTVRFVAKKELTRLFIFGRALAMSDHIIIDRDDPASAIRTINAAAAKSPDGIGILFYAEGTRSPDGGIGPFKKGGVSLALRSALPVVPLSVSGTRKFLPKGCMVIRPGGAVKLVLGEPIATQGMPLEARDELNATVRQRVIDNYVEDY